MPIMSIMVIMPVIGNIIIAIIVILTIVVIGIAVIDTIVIATISIDMLAMVPHIDFFARVPQLVVVCTTIP